MTSREKPQEIDYDTAMKLPDGKSCDDCRNSRRCFGFGFSSPGRTSCDFYPNKFVHREEPQRLDLEGK